MKPAVEAEGQLLMWRIAMKPGRPLAFGKVGAAAFIGLPGNPVSSFVTFLIFVRPFLLKMQGRTGVEARAPPGARRFRLARARLEARVPARKMEREGRARPLSRRRIRRCSPPPRGPTAWSTTPPARPSARATACASCRTRSFSRESESPLFRRPARAARRRRRGARAPGRRRHRRRAAQAPRAPRRRLGERVRREAPGARGGEPGHGEPGFARCARATRSPSFPR